MRNPAWSRDEHIAALNFYLKHPLQIPGKESKGERDIIMN